MNNLPRLSSLLPYTTLLPSPENSNLNVLFAHQTALEFWGEGLGVRETRLASVSQAQPVLEMQHSSPAHSESKTQVPHPRPLSPRIRTTFDFNVEGSGPNSRGEGSQLVFGGAVASKESIEPERSCP